MAEDIDVVDPVAAVVTALSVEGSLAPQSLVWSGSSIHDDDVR